MYLDKYKEKFKYRCKYKYKWSGHTGGQWALNLLGILCTGFLSLLCHKYCGALSKTSLTKQRSIFIEMSLWKSHFEIYFSLLIHNVLKYKSAHYQESVQVDLPCIDTSLKGFSFLDFLRSRLQTTLGPACQPKCYRF